MTAENITDVSIFKSFDMNLKADTSLYYRTDHHWTTFGAYLGYREFAKAAGIEPYGIDKFEITKTPDFNGSLYSKGNFKFIESDTLELYMLKDSGDDSIKYEITYLADNRKTSSPYQLEYLKKKDKYSVFFGGNHPAIVIKTSNHNGRRLMVIKDSYANSMIPFLMNHYEEIHVLDVRFLNMRVKDYIDTTGVNEALVLYNTHGFAKELALSLLK